MNIELEFPPDHQSLPHQATRSAYEPTVPQQVGQIELSLAAPRTILSQKFPVKIPRWGLALLILACTIMGCGYTVGTDFRQDIKTVAIPIFENETNRRGIEFQLTEAVQKEVTKRSQFRLAKGLEADTRLTGKIVGFRKDVLGETAQDDPRELQISLMVKVRWEDHHDPVSRRCVMSGTTCGVYSQRHEKRVLVDFLRSTSVSIPAKGGASTVAVPGCATSA